MTLYQYADGFNNVGSLTDISIQPQGISFPKARRANTVADTVRLDGDYAELVYTDMTSDELSTLLTEYGLASANQNDGTWKLRNDIGTFVNKNGTVKYPEIQPGAWSRFRYSRIVFKITGLHDPS